jgi:hypothetical protein
MNSLDGAFFPLYNETVQTKMQIMFSSYNEMNKYYNVNK